VDVPLLHVAGFMDFLSPTMLKLFEAIQHDGRHQLLVGPWTHYGSYTGHAGANNYRASAGGGPGTLGPMIATWFDRWLRDHTDEAETSSVRYFITGDNQWASTRTWPPLGSELRYYLRSGGHANTRSGDGFLATELADTAERSEPDRFRYDPRDPVPSRGGLLASPSLGEEGIQDQRAVEDRSDVLVYTSAELSEPVRIAGDIRASIHVASSAVDTDVVTKLIDVHPDGYAANVSEGALRARYRHGGHDGWLVPGQVTELTVDLHQAAHTFVTGHRIRLELTSSNFPRLSRNLNSAVLPERGTSEDIVVAEQTVHHNARYPSNLTIHAVVAD
jgi:putative CocE/NonD family hydrolase